MGDSPTKRMYGVVPAIITPFHADGSLDEPALKAHCEFLVGAGVHGLFANGSTGEFALMDDDERLKVAEIVVETVAGRIPVYIHVGTVSTRNAVALARHARGIGADGVAALTPYYFGVGQQEMIGHFESISDGIPDDFPFYLYNIPGATQNSLTIDTVCRLAQRPNIVGIKNSTADFTFNLELLRALPADFDVVMGQELMFLFGLIAGVKGCISGIANAFPEVFLGIYDSFRRGDLEAAKTHQETFMEISKLLYIDGKNLTYYKAALGWRGFTPSFTRQPLYRMEETVARALSDSLDKLNAEGKVISRN